MVRESALARLFYRANAENCIIGELLSLAMRPFPSQNAIVVGHNAI